MNTRFLKDTPRLIRGGTSILFALMVFIFFGYYYPHHLHYHEQFQLFQLTADYARQTLCIPGGLADYIGGFVTQFFVNSRFGAFFLALLFVGIQHFTARRLLSRRTFVYALSYLPAWGMLYYMMDENAIVAAPVALLGCLVTADLLARVRPDGLRVLLTVVLTPLCYLGWGSLAVTFLAAMAVEEIRRGWGQRAAWGLLAALILLIACPIGAQYFWPHTLGRLVHGLHYFRFPVMFPTFVWVSAGLTLLAFLLGVVLKNSKEKAEGRMALKEGGMAAGILLVSFLVPSRSAEMDKEEVMAYDFFARYQQWDQILRLAQAKSPTLAFNVTYLNLALGMTGNLPEYQFRYFQFNEEGLLLHFERDFNSTLVASEAFYQLGFINTAQRYTFEAQEALPDKQKSVRCYQRLAETALINGDYPVARKYLRPLLHTMFYRKWAKDLWLLTQDEAALEKHPIYGRLRHLRSDEDYLFSDTEIDAMLGRLFMSHQDNRLAFEYLISYELLQRNLDLFFKYCSLGSNLGYKKLPRSYQEALLLRWTMTHTDFNGFSWQVDQGLPQQMVHFIQDYRANRPMEYMQQQYAGTYWLYYIQETQRITNKDKK